MKIEENKEFERIGNVLNPTLFGEAHHRNTATQCVQPLACLVYVCVRRSPVGSHRRLSRSLRF